MAQKHANKGDVSYFRLDWWRWRNQKSELRKVLQVNSVGFRDLTTRVIFKSHITIKKRVSFNDSLCNVLEVY